MDRLNAFIQRFKNEPAVAIAILGVAAVAALQSLAGNNVVGSDLVETIGNFVGTAEQPGPVILLVGGLITRFFVWGPKSAAALKAEVPEGYAPINP